MFDQHKELNKFYEDYVRLGKKRRDWLAGVRNSNLERLKGGLDALGERDGVYYAYFKEKRNQGGYAMRTLNQHANNGYDIDVALIFESDDLPDNPAEARQLICDAFKEKPGKFRRPPKARTNAVTVWYADGPHIDFAIYRRRRNFLGIEVIEHAGGDEWIARDPDAVTSWFGERVEALSPAPSLFGTCAVDSGQLRRIVRLLKFFCRSRQDWDLPGGMITTTLVVECYRPNTTRDDKALYDTVAALHYRLSASLTVLNPIDWNQELTAKAECRDQVEDFCEKLAWALEKLAILHESKCTETQARNAWRLVFNHDFWSAAMKGGSLLQPASVVSGLVFPNRPTGPVKPAGFA